MAYDYDRRATRREAAGAHVWVDKGKYLLTVNAVTQADVAMAYYDCPQIPVALEFQLFDDMNGGSPVHASYRGVGQVVDRGHHKVLILGDPQHSATLHEYRIADKATPESEKVLDDIAAGVHAAIGSLAKAGRRMTSKGHHWLQGYDEAIAYRKKITPK